MNQLFTGSMCLTDIIEKAKKGHSAFSKSKKNGKVYFNMLTWINEEKDQYGNTMSHQLNSTKEKREAEGKFYIGNSKPTDNSVPVKSGDIDDDLGNVPVRTNEATTPEPMDDLPF